MRNVRSEVIEDCHIRVRVVLVISVRRVLHVVPFCRWIYVLVEKRVLRLALVVYRIETYYLVKIITQI